MYTVFSLQRLKAQLSSVVVLAAIALTPQLSAACPPVETRMAGLFFPEKVHFSVTVIAHRGLWGESAPNPRTPENSLASLQAADDACIDAVELDVKMTKDGIPVIMHDYNLGRTTDIYNFIGDKTQYDPILNTGSNPAVNTVPWETVQRLHLLTPSRDSATDYTVPDVTAVFSYWKDHHLTIPLIFDAKTKDAVHAIDVRAREQFGDRARDIVAVKVNATLYPTYASFSNDATAIRAIPVYTTNMLGKIDVPASIDDWRERRGSTVFEINVKQFGGLLQDQLDPVKNSNDNYGVGVFNAVPDGPGDRQFYSNDGHCCYRLSDLYFSYSGGKDTADNRGDWNYVIDQSFTFITTDKPTGLRDYLRARGLHD
ncbi:glycerophosphodiester phosphodiesterase family protein [Paraburkholderia youngii]|uniref:glycerophosphodiester phosphodiesterase family protein n=1 Tax=Paraburkholderia youngii TaxID=2782701 RepID=UPI00159255AD|nr:glycerophosphodiester phosphodiesterase family protein [Paraburkholderia youngii]NUX59517.1 glycerophosphodiester phosphodiesterase family protein [Paraburkholderia youngii]